MKYLFVLFVLLYSGCGKSDANILLNTGKTPPKIFTITDKKTMDTFIFDTKKFSFNFPTSKQSDFKQIGKWHGVSIRDGHTISFGLDMYYSISLSTDYTIQDYAEEARQYDLFNESYFQKKYPKIFMKDGRIISIKRHLEYHGKENYVCDISETKEIQSNRFKKNYECYKFNPQKTKSKSVTITLTYNKPNDPTLAKKYTYQDLQNRAKRMLDSLYIKERW